MIKILFIFLILTFPSSVLGHMKHYENIKKIEMNIVRDGKIIGFCNYEFLKEGNSTKIKNKTEFKVKLMGIKIFSVISSSTEIYDIDKLISFNSKTIQNKKKKYVNLKYLERENKYLIDGSSYKGTSKINNVIGNWWNHKLLTADKQISPLSGSIKDQIVTFVKKENINIKGKNYLTHKFNLKSKNPDLPDDKKLDFVIWLEPKKNIIIKISYNRMGNWEYILKNITLN